MARGKHGKRAARTREERETRRRKDLAERIAAEEARLIEAENEADEIPRLLAEIEELKERIEARDHDQVVALEDECRQLVEQIAEIALTKWTGSEGKLLDRIIFGLPTDVLEGIRATARDRLWEMFPDAEDALERDLARNALAGSYLLIQPEGMRVTTSKLPARLRAKLTPEALAVLDQRNNARLRGRR